MDSNTEKILLDMADNAICMARAEMYSRHSDIVKLANIEFYMGQYFSCLKLTEKISGSWEMQVKIHEQYQDIANKIIEFANNIRG